MKPTTRVDIRPLQSGYNDIEAIRLWKCGDGDKVLGVTRQHKAVGKNADFTRTECFFAVDLFMVYRFIHMFIHDVICVYIYNYNIYIYYIYEVYIYIY